MRAKLNPRIVCRLAHSGDNNPLFVRLLYFPEDRWRGSSAGLTYVRAKGPGPSI